MEKILRKRISLLKSISSLGDEISDGKSFVLEQIESRLSRLNIYADKINEVQEKIEENCDEDGFEAQLGERKIFTHTIEQIRDELLLIKSKLPSNAKTNSIETKQSREPMHQPIHLPTIQLPSFYGKLEEYPAFWDLFESLIHQNASLSAVQKLHYLKLSLKGESTQSLQSLPITSDNYEVALEILKNRYDNKKLLINSLLQKLTTERSVESESSNELRRLLDNFSKYINLLKNLEEPVWNSMVVYLITSKLDSSTRRQWEIESPQREIPDFETMKTFLEKRIQALSSIEPNKPKNFNPKPPHTNSFRSKSFNMNATTTEKPTLVCHFCKESHLLFKCNQFNDASLKDRKLFVKKHNLCENCFKHNHGAADCKKDLKCKHCGEKHNTLLHGSSSLSMLTKNVSYHSILPTALVRITNNRGGFTECRALLDSCSHESFISKNLADVLKLKLENGGISVDGLGGVSCGNSSRKMTINISSRLNNFSITIDAYLWKKIANLNSEISSENIAVPTHLELADPNFHKSGTIDLLLGVEVTSVVSLDGHVGDFHSNLVAQNTKFGWVISGKCGKTSQHAKSLFCVSDPLDISLQSFWDIEEGYNIQKILTPEEKECESHYSNTVSRLTDGRFSVRLPFKLSPKLLGETRNTAIRILESTLRRLNHDQLELYKTFLNEYESLGHMRRTKNVNEPNAFYLPHHAVFKPESETSKIRVVFNGSKKSSTGYSLNDLLMTGPTLQDDLFHILIRFRTYPIALCADIEKMYRQVHVDEADQKFQRIVWREGGQIVDFELTTVTYGLTSSSYQAIRTLHELAKSEKEEFPLACEKIEKDFFVDDFISGADDLKSAQALISDLNVIMSKGKFNLRKWRSNSAMNPHNPEFAEQSHLALDVDKQCSKALGLWWNHSTDNFFFRIKPQELQVCEKATKRELLSAISKLFDPLGFLAPIIVNGKILMQDLWQEPVGWNDPVPEKVVNRYSEMRNDLSNIESLIVPRHVSTSSNITYELHGFADASEKAYAACIYVVVSNKTQNLSFLLCAKTRVAPLKTKTLPRLELCGALLLAKLFQEVASTLKYPITNCFAYSDSIIVLSWLQKSPSHWKTFVANRISKIQSVIPPSQWYHVFSETNPADVASRGCSMRELASKSLWWNGPDFLTDHALRQAIKPFALEDEAASCEAKKPKVTVLLTNAVISDTISKISSYNKLIHTLAYCLRYIHNLRVKPEQRRMGLLSVAEIDQGLKAAIKTVQEHEFSTDLQKLRTTNRVGRKSPLLSLSPWLDSNGIMRVGGRLENSSLPIDVKHQYILPKNCHFTEILIRHYHSSNLHAAPDLLHSLLRQKFWILQGRCKVKTMVKRCITCVRLNSNPKNAQMGNLPACRIEPTRPFLHTGVDYCGPFTLKPASKLRYKTTYKCYISLFVCMATKAMHLELVSDLSTESFIATLKRFISRRGKPAHIYSDNGTNFVGAKRLLDVEFNDFLKSKPTQTAIQSFLSSNSVQWHFNPPLAPNFGGLWEAGVKSIKKIIMSVIGVQVMSFEEFYTILTQVEACVNSRPLCQMSDDVNDLSVLTPGHFLIGDSLLAPPFQAQLAKNLSIRRMWNITTQVVKQFWERWSKEYLHTLQNRPKWQLPSNNDIKIGDLALIKDSSDVMSWAKARVLATHPGKDGVVRVVSVKTANSILKRPVNKIVKLPVECSYVC